LHWFFTDFVKNSPTLLEMEGNENISVDEVFFEFSKIQKIVEKWG
jgi:hypothetical protein